MEQIILILGSNLGNRKEALHQAMVLLEARVGNIKMQSSLYETAPWGIISQPSFLNQVVVLSTVLPPITLLENILQIELELGRTREVKWGERIIDIDILFYGSEIIASDKLNVPHPELHKRRFTLVPLVEILPELIHPVLKLSMKELLADCKDSLTVEKVG